MTELIDLTSESRTTLVVILLAGPLIKAPRGWRCGSKIVPAAYLVPLVSHGLVKFGPRDRDGEAQRAQLTDEGRVLARAEHARLIGKAADSLSEGLAAQP